MSKGRTCSMRLSVTRVPVSGRRLMPAALLASCFLLARCHVGRARRTAALPPISIGAGVSDRPSCTPTRGDRRRFDRSLPARQRPPLRERSGHRARSSSCSTPSTTAAATTSTCSTPSRASSSRTSSTSGSAASCRRATAPTSTVRTTRITGRLHRRRPGRLSVRLRRPRQRRRVLGPVRQGQGVGRRLRRPVGHGRRTRCSARGACRSTSGIRKPATT